MNDIKYKTPNQYRSATNCATNCDLLLLYVNEIERQELFQALKTLFGLEPTLRSKDPLSWMDFGPYIGQRIFAMRTAMGSGTPGGSSSLVVKAIHIFQPNWIIAVGVAFGKDSAEQDLGSILVSNKITTYDPQRRNKDGSPTYRGESVSVPIQILGPIQDATAFPDITGNVQVHVGELLSSAVLIDDPKFKADLIARFPDAIGGEMEAAGIRAADYLNPVPGGWIIIKGVCDYADGNKKQNKKEHQQLAARHAAEFALRAWESLVHSSDPAQKPTQKPSKGAIFSDPLSCGVMGPKMREIPPGAFTMGNNEKDALENELPSHIVHISRHFAVSLTPVTIEEYQLFVAHNASAVYRSQPFGKSKILLPVVNVNWHDAIRYCKWLTNQTGRKYYLLSEAQWEYVVKLSNDKTSGKIWHKENSQGKIHSVLDSDAEGSEGEIRQMCGNIFEWCHDDLRRYNNEPQNDPIGPESSMYSAIRGGGYLSPPEQTRKTYRCRYRKDTAVKYIGFRIACEIN